MIVLLDGSVPAFRQILVFCFDLYLEEDNRVLKEPLGNMRLELTDDQRRRLAVTGKMLGGAYSRRSSHPTRSCDGTIT